MSSQNSSLVFHPLWPNFFYYCLLFLTSKCIFLQFLREILLTILRKLTKILRKYMETNPVINVRKLPSRFDRWWLKSLRKAACTRARNSLLVLLWLCAFGGFSHKGRFCFPPKLLQDQVQLVLLMHWSRSEHYRKSSPWLRRKPQVLQLHVDNVWR